MATKSPSKTAPKPEAPEASPEAAKPEAPKPLATVETFEPSDGTTIDRPRYVAAFVGLTVNLLRFAFGSSVAGEASRVGAGFLFDLREACIRSDNGAPDYAGKTTAYKEAVGTFLTKWAAENKWTDTDGNEHQLTSTDVESFKSRMSSYASDHQLMSRRMAEWEARNNSQASADLATVTAAFDAPAGTALPPEVRQNVRAVMGKQVGFKSGEAFQNFDPDLNVATVSGRKPKPGPNTTGPNETAEGPGKAWLAIVKQVTKGEGGFLPLPVLADMVHQLASLMVLQTAGPIGGPVTPNAKLPAAGKGKADALKISDKAGTLLTTYVAAMDGKNKAVSKDALTDLLWNENKEATS